MTDENGSGSKGSEGFDRFLAQVKRELKSAAVFALQVLRHPVRSVRTIGSATWWMLIASYLLVAAASVFIGALSEGWGFGLFSFASSMFLIFAPSILFYAAVLVGICWLILEKFKHPVSVKDLAELVVVASIPTLLMASAVGHLPASLSNGGVFVFSLVFVGLFYFGLRKRFQVAPHLARAMSLILLLIMLFPVTRMSNRSSNLSLSSFEKSMEERVGEVAEGVDQEGSGGGDFDPKNIRLSKKVQEWIDREFASDPRKKRLVEQMARFHQFVLDFPEDLQGGRLLGDRASACGRYVFNDSLRMQEIHQELTALTFDTAAKARVWARRNQSFSGKVFPLNDLPGPEACD
jgi:hypothetical protein